MLVSPYEPLEKVKHNINNRKIILEPVQIGSHCKIFCKGTICGIHESKTVQLKHLEAHATERTTLADRVISKGSKLTCYVSAFANYIGGYIYYGVTDEGIVVGEDIQNEEDQSKITKKVEKAIKKMVWPEQIGKPKRGENWDIFFEPVVDEDNKPIPSTFVIAIYIAPCLGGVFTEEPECYQMVEEKVRRMSFTTWKKGACWLDSWEESPVSVQCINWSSVVAQQSFTDGDEILGKLIGNGHWSDFPKAIDEIRQKNSQSLETALLILSKQITAGYCTGQFKKADEYLEQYETIVPQTKDRLIFDVIKLYLKAAVKRASGDLEAVEECLNAALSMAEQIEPGLVPAIVYLFAATVADLIYTEDTHKKYSPDTLSRKALDHLYHVPDSSDVRADMEQKAHMTLATFYLGCNMNGVRIRDNIDISDLENVKVSITAANESIYSASPRTKYREGQFNLVLSIYNYRRSQIHHVRSNFGLTSPELCRRYIYKDVLKWPLSKVSAQPFLVFF